MQIQMLVPTDRTAGIRGKVLCLMVPVLRSGFSSFVPGIFFLAAFSLLCGFCLVCFLVFAGGFLFMVTSAWVAAFVFSSVLVFLSGVSVFSISFAFDFRISSVIRGGCVEWAGQSVPDWFAWSGGGSVCPGLWDSDGRCPPMVLLPVLSEPALHSFPPEPLNAGS